MVAPGSVVGWVGGPAVGVAGDFPVAFVGGGVVGAAEEYEVVLCGGAAVGAGGDVVDVAPGWGCVTSPGDAGLVADDHSLAEVVRDHSGGCAEVENLGEAQDHPGEDGVAGEAADGFWGDGADAFDVAAGPGEVGGEPSGERVDVGPSQRVTRASAIRWAWLRGW